MKVTTNIPIAEWQQFVNSHKEGTVFQSPEMNELFLETRKFDPLVIGVHEDGELRAVLMGVFIHERGGIGKLLSSRFVIYGGPLLKGSNDQQSIYLDALLDSLIRNTRNKALFIQFRNFFSQEQLLPVYIKHKFERIDRLNYIVKISDKQSVLNHISEGRRRQIKKAINNGSSIIEPENLEQIKELYEILYRLYRYKVRKPLPGWSFFESFYKGSRQGKLGIIRLVKYEEKIIGGIIAPLIGDKCIYEWYVCGLDLTYKDQHPSVLATWAGIEYAIENNIKNFDFMGVGKPDQYYGVRDFKARFGGELVNYGRLTRINNPFLYSIAEFGYNVMALLKKI